MSIVGMDLSIFMAFWAHYDGFFAKVSFTMVHLLLTVMAILSLSLIKFKYTLNLEASAAIESQMICFPPCNKTFPLNFIFNLSIFSCKTSENHPFEIEPFFHPLYASPSSISL
jgi:hypothetical protein